MHVSFEHTQKKGFLWVKNINDDYIAEFVKISLTPTVYSIESFF